MIDYIPWLATGATIIAALMTASNLGSRITGYGFCVFLVGSLAWMATGFVQGDRALVVTNIILTFTNAFGIWRWLGRQAQVDDGADAASRRSEAAPGEDLFPVGQLTTAKLFARGEEVASCVNAMAGRKSGRIVYLVVSRGGVGGVGETLHRIDWSSCRSDGEKVTVELDPSAIEQLPQVSRNQWPAR